MPSPETQRAIADLPDGVEMREVDRFAEPQFTSLVRELLGGDPTADLRSRRAADVQTRLEERHRCYRPAWSLRIGAYRGSRLIAWTHGFQDGRESFLMATSAVVPEERRQGIYTALVRRVLERTREAGFEVVTSRHLASNNPVLIAKLKLGFRVVGTELSETLGTLVVLRHVLDPERAELLTRRLSPIRY